VFNNSHLQNGLYTTARYKISTGSIIRQIISFCQQPITGTQLKEIIKTKTKCILGIPGSGKTQRIVNML